MSTGVIDYIAVKEDHQNGNIGCFLINLAQEITSRKINKAAHYSRLSACFRTYLACRFNNITCYKSYVFEIMDDLDRFKQGGLLHEIGKRLDFE